MKKAFFVFTFAWLISFGILMGYTVPASAHSKFRYRPLPQNTHIVIQDPGNQDLGKSFTLHGTLTDDNGAGISQKSVSFLIDGRYLGQAATQYDGSFQLKINQDLTASAHRVTASFKGAHLLYSTATDIFIYIRPTVVRVQTIPAVAGITFQMDGIQFVSDEQGEAKINLYKAGQYKLDVLIEKYQSTTQRVEFGRWVNESYVPSVDIRVPTDNVIQVGLNVYHQVSPTYVDLDGFPVDPQRISFVTIKSIQGDVFTLKDNQPHWLPASRVARYQAGLQETKLLYSIINVTIDGSNVVNQAQQRFYANPNDTWSISLMLYSMHIDAKDGLFGSPVGKGVNVLYPDGQDKVFPLDQAGMVDIHSLARGIYHIELLGTNGLGTQMPVALSRIQEVHINVVTYLDMAVVGVMGFVLALGLLLYGRPWIVRHFFTKTQVLVPKKLRSYINEN
jgi:hypothetical protein